MWLLMTMLACVGSSEPEPPAPPTAPASHAPATTKADGPPPSLRELEALAGPWWSEAACDRAVKAGARATPHRSEDARVGTWNVRWFPQGSYEGKGDGTNVKWLACMITWMDVDVLALQEIMARPEDDDEHEELLSALRTYSGADWKLSLDTCSNIQHTGFLWRTDRVAGSGIEGDWHFNARANASDVGGCEAFPAHSEGYRPLRPGTTGRFTWTRGLDLGLSSVHLKSSPKRDAYDERREAMTRLAASLQTQADGDHIVLGDFNSMGCESGQGGECPVGGATAVDEVALLRNEANRAGYRALEPAPACTHYWSGGDLWGTLDHVLVSNSTEELTVKSATTLGPCAFMGCRGDGAKRHAYKQLSDHCPLVVTLSASDMD